MKDPRRTQRALEAMVWKRWFLVLFILLGTAVPPITTKGFEPSETGKVVVAILQNSLVTRCSPLYPVFKITPIVLVLALISLKNRARKAFFLYGGTTYLLFALLQGIGVTDEHGLGVVTGNLVLMVIVAVFWFSEAFVERTDFSFQKLHPARYWVILPAFLAFWYPVDPTSMKPDWNPVYLFTNLAGLAFCTMTPVYLGILTLCYPKVNGAVLRVTALAGILIAFWNVVVNFLMEPEVLWWNGILHLPLLGISAYALFLSKKEWLPGQDSNLQPSG